jgi:hypothetical protein
LEAVEPWVQHALDAVAERVAPEQWTIPLTDELVELGPLRLRGVEGALEVRAAGVAAVPLLFAGGRREGGEVVATWRTSGVRQVFPGVGAVLLEW